MKNVKFKVWDKKLNMWSIDLMLMSEYGGLWSTRDGDELFRENEEDFDIELFTGLFDKNGKEIYEGDILHIPLVTGKYEVNSAVEWIDKKCCFRVNGMVEFGKFKTQYYEIIGNIHENPELLT